MNITKEQRALRNAIIEHAETANPDLDNTTSGLISVLGSVIEGVPVEKALGSPGDWGYDTPIGKALRALMEAS